MLSKESVKASQKEHQWPQATGKFPLKDKKLKIAIQIPNRMEKVAFLRLQIKSKSVQLFSLTV